MQVLFNIINEFFVEYNIFSAFIRLTLAAVMGGIIGVERGRFGRAAGLRTHIVVCVGATLTALTGLFLNNELGYNGDVARLSAQVISGIGFLGAGTIMVRNSSVITGLTTAAGMWTTAVIGLALGYGFYGAAFFATVLCFFCVALLGKFERQRRGTYNFYLELDDLSAANEIIRLLQNIGNSGLSYDIVPAKSGMTNHAGITASLYNKQEYDAFCQAVVNKKAVVLFVNDAGV